MTKIRESRRFCAPSADARARKVMYHKALLSIALIACPLRLRS